MSRPRRLDGFRHIGRYRYFLTFCCGDRLSAFEDPQTAEQTLEEFRRTSTLEQFAILAYCLMPDHAHLLVEGLAPDSDFKRFAKMAKQRSGGLYARSHQQRLWQAGYYERVLRDQDDARAFARYVVNNPVRGGLVETPTDYPFVGSDLWTLVDVLESVV
jgi:REP element-mobilizing transposase RayT